MNEYTPPNDMDRETLKKFRDLLALIYPGATFELAECVGTNLLDFTHEGKYLVIEHDRDGRREWGLSRCDDTEVFPFDTSHDHYLPAETSTEILLDKVIQLRHRLSPKPR